MFLNDYYNPDKGRFQGKKIVHFVGTDIWQLRKISLDGLQIWKSYMRNGVDEVLVEADFTQMELKEILGIDAKIVPIPPAKLYDVMPLPEKFTVAVYMPDINAVFYNPQLMEEVAKAMPDIEFKFYGSTTKLGRHASIKNIDQVGYVSDMEAFIKSCSSIIRFPFHDGLPISVLEFILAGRYAYLNVPVKETYIVPNSDLKSIVQSIVLMQERAKEGPNQAAHDYWIKELDHQKFKDTILSLSEYDPKSYWDKRANSWDIQATTLAVEDVEIEPLYREVNPLTVLDVGCGSGRWIPILKKWGLDLKNYTGFDVAKTLIDIAGSRYPEVKDKLSVSLIEEFEPKEKVDLAFCYTALEHVAEKNILKATENLKKSSTWLLLIE